MQESSNRPLHGANESGLQYAKHIKYWRRNLKTYLPHHYTSNDSNRLTLGFFILSALDILGDLQPALSAEERQGYIKWVYSCQIPTGGFRGSPGTDFGSLRNDGNAVWDPPTVPATYFALGTLALLGDDLQGVKRREILIWLTRMQRPDGSFGETLGLGDRIEGGNDTRFGYLSTGIRWMLRGTVEGPVDGVPDVDVDQFVKCIRDSETYDGGISEDSLHEAHAGFTCCAVSALSLVDRLPLPANFAPKADDRIRGVSNLPLMLHWLTARQTMTLDEEDALDTYADETDSTATCHDGHAFLPHNYTSEAGRKSIESQPTSHFEMSWVGMNGRANKIADTCYAWWSCAPLKLLGHLELVNKKPIRRWLLDKTQHIVGGFGKLPGYPPDIYHSYLGLITLSMFGETGLQDVDPALCISTRAKEHLESLPWRKAVVGEPEPSKAETVPDLSYMTITGG
ncbi:geranylgeranyl transferas-like protein type i beta subunit [Clohesyomyces aquaticus]|uniref:Geranylgeranyl transferas-like protein type i beta subunit n=1 Tax=Clohesyomyces aquaticus TaxID=1231657 RepID=A0A1Y1YPS8_9PLEO|nr:geranylgeranyl transferas-like protein type i beta subunit [Clohesyomyces aquaticus]